VQATGDHPNLQLNMLLYMQMVQCVQLSALTLLAWLHTFANSWCAADTAWGPD